MAGRGCRATCELVDFTVDPDSLNSIGDIVETTCTGSSEDEAISSRASAKTTDVY